MKIGLAAISNLNNITYDNINISIDKVRKFIDRLFQMDTAGTYIQVPSHVLRKMFGKNYKTYIKFMVAYHMINVSNSYHVDEYTKRYKINPDNLEDINKYLLQGHVGLGNMPDKMDYVYQYMTKCLDMFDIDYEGALDDIFNLPYDNITQQHLLHTVNSFKYRNYHITIDNNGRYYSDITNMKRDIRRKYINYQGHSLVELDIPNSQCLFLAKWMREEGIEDEVFINDITDHTIYSQIQEKKNISRKDAKTTMYVYMFGKIYMVDYFLNGRYKKVSKFLNKKKKQMNSYKEVAHTLQRMEANFVYGNVAMEFIRHEIPFITVHDAFLVPKYYQANAKRILNLKIKELGF